MPEPFRSRGNNPQVCWCRRRRRARGPCAPSGDDLTHVVHGARVVRGVQRIDGVIDTGRPLIVMFGLEKYFTRGQDTVGQA